MYINILNTGYENKSLDMNTKLIIRGDCLSQHSKIWISHFSFCFKICGTKISFNSLIIFYI